MNLNLDVDCYVLDMLLNPHNDARPQCTLHVAAEVISYVGFLLVLQL